MGMEEVIIMDSHNTCNCTLVESDWGARVAVCAAQVVVKYLRLIGAEEEKYFLVIECHCKGAIRHVHERHWHFVEWTCRLMLMQPTAGTYECLNTGKTQVLAVRAGRQAHLDQHITCTDTPLAQTSTAPYLGATQDENLRWLPQLTSIMRRTAMKVQIIRQIRRQIRHCPTVWQPLLYYSALIISDILFESNAFLPGLSA